MLTCQICLQFDTLPRDTLSNSGQKYQISEMVLMNAETIVTSIF